MNRACGAFENAPARPNPAAKEVKKIQQNDDRDRDSDDPGENTFHVSLHFYGARGGPG